MSSKPTAGAAVWSESEGGVSASATWAAGTSGPAQCPSQNPFPERWEQERDFQAGWRFFLCHPVKEARGCCPGTGATPLAHVSNRSGPTKEPAGSQGIPQAASTYPDPVATASLVCLTFPGQSITLKDLALSFSISYGQPCSWESSGEVIWSLGRERP